ncbi:hypothetical protein ATO00_13180 [Loigolactobacillus coryniformis subsp. coryniformis]|nr:hypothetical protein [Loigolactobacillus coryniformis]ATO56146.1 hypothetical protein LC20001_11175 [Loigolactobacillus coryniformis subsp. coryniformis KCTC 3167 = DSM 20001]OEH89168.1 hypothetical protein ATO00_13180 [Loigolactobacillus coryniformis subsp. coryniformis]
MFRSEFFTDWLEMNYGVEICRPRLVEETSLLVQEEVPISLRHKGVVVILRHRLSYRSKDNHWQAVVWENADDEQPIMYQYRHNGLTIERRCFL